jgi:hypothetical protein
MHTKLLQSDVLAERYRPSNNYHMRVCMELLCAQQVPFGLSRGHLRVCMDVLDKTRRQGRLWAYIGHNNERWLGKLIEVSDGINCPLSKKSKPFPWLFDLSQTDKACLYPILWSQKIRLSVCVSVCVSSTSLSLWVYPAVKTVQHITESVSSSAVCCSPVSRWAGVLKKSHWIEYFM